MTPFEIPLQSTPQKLSIALGDTTYVLTITWNPPSQCWILSIADANNVPVAEGIALVTGADLLEQLDYLGFTGALIVETDHDIDALPTFENLGSTSHVYFVTP